MFSCRPLRRRAPATRVAVHVLAFCCRSWQEWAARGRQAIGRKERMEIFREEMEIFVEQAVPSPVGQIDLRTTGKASLNLLENNV